MKMESTKPKSMEELNQYLQEHGVKPSYQRTRIFEYLLNHMTHPTVDEIYQALSDQIPTLSKTTVYNTLKAFMEAQLVRMVNIEDHEARYDVDLSTHGHFKCEQCGTIYDFELDMTQFKNEFLDTFLIKERNVYYQGVCKQCLSKSKQH
ncbi:Fur family transcriptional regulator [Anoxynatronum buryatiense]|uniref:Fur family transcriptional regulator, peroxide stress response regulator n=1 Tax=Anoxynatronum buryatiense TaxID=489973 RepID=A0AA45WTS9_9CLOT|nr:Fur family transcriptional regulator [Anoxynatronum buryatiense]SMP44131.1 Fur family transcriptional regulator, peroxide stress response regulator [Anoxynatronum buryatiense]